MKNANSTFPAKVLCRISSINQVVHWSKCLSRESVLKFEYSREVANFFYTLILYSLCHGTLKIQSLLSCAQRVIIQVNCNSPQEMTLSHFPNIIPWTKVNFVLGLRGMSIEMLDINWQL